MIYQTDFDAKEKNSDGSINSVEYFTRKYGCYFMSLLYASDTLKGCHYKEDIVCLYCEYLKRGSIDHECFVRSAVDFFYDTGQVEKVQAISVGEFIPGSYKHIIGRFRLYRPEFIAKGQQSHFVVLDDSLKVVYDPIEGGSPHVREGVLVDLRVF